MLQKGSGIHTTLPVCAEPVQRDQCDSCLMTNHAAVTDEVTWVATWHWIDPAGRHQVAVRTGTDLDQVEEPEGATSQRIRFVFEVVLIPVQPQMRVRELWGVDSEGSLGFAPGRAGILTISYSGLPVMVYGPGTWVRAGISSGGPIA